MNKWPTYGKECYNVAAQTFLPACAESLISPGDRTPVYDPTPIQKDTRDLPAEAEIAGLETKAGKPITTTKVPHRLHMDTNP